MSSRVRFSEMQRAWQSPGYRWPIDPIALEDVLDMVVAVARSSSETTRDRLRAAELLQSMVRDNMERNDAEGSGGTGSMVVVIGEAVPVQGEGVNGSGQAGLPAKSDAVHSGE